MEHYKIDDTDVFIEEIAPHKGKITISNTSGHNYSTSWVAMGGTLKEFLCKINEDYFTSNLIGRNSSKVMDVNKTFRYIRGHIHDQMGLKAYKHRAFIKNVMKQLSIFEKNALEIQDENAFVSYFPLFIESINFYLIEDESEREVIEDNFHLITEPWEFIVRKDSDNTIWLKKLHGKIKKVLLKEKAPVTA